MGEVAGSEGLARESGEVGDNLAVLGKASDVPTLILAVDGGGSKTDVVVADDNGQVLGRARGGGSCPQIIGLDAAANVIDVLVIEALAEAHSVVSVRSVPPAVGGIYVSGLDFEFEVDAMRAVATERGWAQDLLVENDTFALLRAGTDAPDAVAVICGTGINCVGVRADGVHVRFPALGPISGDWGGGEELGKLALFHAVRAEDRRGLPTSLEALVPQALGMMRPIEVTEAIHLGELPYSIVNSLVPVLLKAATDGDELARSVLAQQADEIVALASATILRLDLLDQPVPVVLGGGVMAARDPFLMAEIERRLAVKAPLATMTIVVDPPVVGAALLGMDHLGISADAQSRLRGELAAEAPNAAA